VAAAALAAVQNITPTLVVLAVPALSSSVTHLLNKVIKWQS
jgi:predicted phosphoribosyltransferase